MNLKLGKHPLGMMASSVSTDLELSGNGLVGASLRQQPGNLGLPASEAKSPAQDLERYRTLWLRSLWGLPQQYSLELTQLTDCTPDFPQQVLIVVTQPGE